MNSHPSKAPPIDNAVVYLPRSNKRPAWDQPVRGAGYEPPPARVMGKANDPLSLPFPTEARTSWPASVVIGTRHSRPLAVVPTSCAQKWEELPNREQVWCTHALSMSGGGEAALQEELSQGPSERQHWQRIFLSLKGRGVLNDLTRLPLRYNVFVVLPTLASSSKAGFNLAGKLTVPHTGSPIFSRHAIFLDPSCAAQTPLSPFITEVAWRGIFYVSQYYQMGTDGE